MRDRKDKPPIQPPLGGVMKIQDRRHLENKIIIQRNERKLKEEVEIKHTGRPPNVLKFRSTTASTSTSGSAIFGEITTITSSCALLLASKMCES